MVGWVGSRGKERGGRGGCTENIERERGGFWYLLEPFREMLPRAGAEVTPTPVITRLGGEGGGKNISYM